MFTSEHLTNTDARCNRYECFVGEFPSHSPYYPIFQALVAARFEWIISESIYLEYLEILQQRGSQASVALFEDLALNTSNLIKVDPSFYWLLVKKDPDDDKFVDAYIAGNADYLVTWDSHFNLVKEVFFPKVNIITPEEFLQLLS